MIENYRIFTNNDKDIGTVMTNFDHSIDEELAEKLKESFRFVGDYAAWNFHALVWFQNNKYYCQIWRYHKVVEQIEAETLKEIMELASEKYGYD